MDSIFEQYKRTGYLHHAHIIPGAYDVVSAGLVSALARNLGIEIQGNPDFSMVFHDSFGVDEARALKEVQSRAGFAGARKIFIIGAKSFTTEAQNALLKTFEEPTEGTHFFIILPHTEMLLPTLRSRVLIVEGVNTNSEDEAKVFVEKFLDALLEEKFAMIKKLTEKKAGESVDREVVRRVLDHVERMLYTRTAGKRDEVTTQIFYEIHQAKKYLADRGSSPKMLLEHIAVTLG